MKVLIIHHLERIWENGYKKFGTSFDELVEKFYEHLSHETYDLVILTRFEDFRLDDDYWPIAQYVDRVETYAYGWEKQEMLDNPGIFCEGGSHSEAVLIEDWMRLSGHDVYISGAFDGECIEDLEIALRHCQVKFFRIEDLII
jgi:hypothetical protein